MSLPSVWSSSVAVASSGAASAPVLARNQLTDYMWSPSVPAPLPSPLATTTATTVANISITTTIDSLNDYWRHFCFRQQHISDLLSMQLW